MARRRGARRWRRPRAQLAEHDRAFLDRVPGFVEFHLLRGPERDDHVLYSSHTVWASKDAFTAWTQSEHFRAAHRDAGSNKPLYLGHPEFEGFEVLQTIKNPRHEAA